MKTRLIPLFLSFLVMFLAATVYAGDGVTVIFKSGQVVVIDNGYEKIIDRVRVLKGKSTENEFVELNLNGGVFLLSLEQIALVCRDDCRKLIVSHQQDPARGRNN